MARGGPCFRPVSQLAFVLAAVAASTGPLIRWAQQAAEVPREASQAKAFVESARKEAGDVWAEAFAFYCAADQRRANRADDAVIDPVQIFDNLYAIGRTSTLVFVVKTTAGLILIDAGSQADVEPVLLQSLEHVGEIARKMRVDVELVNHPLMDGTVSSNCLKAVLARRAEARAASKT